MERKNWLWSKYLASFLLIFLISIAGFGCSAENNNQTADQEKIENKAQDAIIQKDAEEKPKSEEVITKNDDELKETAKEEKITETSKPTKTNGTTAQIPVTLLKTIDGDTIKIRYEGKEQNVRYLLIDTPETSHPRLGKQPFGEDAKNRNRELVNSGKLTIEFDVGQRIDKYGRLLVYVYADGKSVQETLLKEGLARVAYVYPPNTRYLTPYEEAQQQAKNKGLGIWSIENYATDKGFNSDVNQNIEPKSESKPAPAPQHNPAPDPPSQSSRSCAGQIKGSQNGIYHTPGSTYYDRTTNVVQWFCSPEEAEKAGYRAPKR